MVSVGSVSVERSWTEKTFIIEDDEEQKKYKLVVMLELTSFLWLKFCSLLLMWKVRHVSGYILVYDEEFNMVEVPRVELAMKIAGKADEKFMAGEYVSVNPRNSLCV